MPHREEGLGSGVILSADGYILTANHVVQGADEVKVDLPNGEKGVLAKVIGADPPTDIAVLKVNATSLPPATIADSDKLEVGDVVLAIGNPFGVGQTVTMGIVSGKGRNALASRSMKILSRPTRQLTWAIPAARLWTRKAGLLASTPRFSA